MRIVTKWCNYLEKYFTENYFFRREEPFKMRDGAIRSLDDVDLVFLNKLFERERKPIEDFMRDILKHNYEMQSQVSKRTIDR